LCVTRSFDILTTISSLELLLHWYTNLISVVMGLLVGSFVNVVIYRLPLKKSLIKPRSSCTKCKKMVAWYDNIPVFSYLFLLGKCRSCGEKISFRYPVVELMVALLFLATNIKFGFNWLLIIHDWPFVAALVAIIFIDLDHRIIPDELSLGGLVLGLATCYFVPGLGWKLGFIGGVVGFCVFYAFSWIYYKMSGKIGLGGGDIKLLAMVGAYLGPSGVFTTILMSSILGSFVGIIWAKATKQESVMKVAIPYGPFMVAGALYHYLLGDIFWLPFRF
jgi:leader peptidase (prepilin peptidase) / N-methyltransferase